MNDMLMFTDFFRRNMPTAIVARRSFFITGIAQERAPLEILFESRLIVRRQIPRIARQRQLVAAAIALVGVPLG